MLGLSITQVIDLLEGVRCSALPLLCERIIEVQVRDWMLAPAIQKDGQFCTRKAPPPLAGQEKKGERSNEENEGDTSVFNIFLILCLTFLRDFPN